MRVLSHLHIATCLIAALLIGCAEDDYAEVVVQPVTGTLSVKGKPAYGAYIVFHPSESVGLTKGNKPFARAAADGRFSITTYTSDDGVPVGNFRVTIIWPEDPESRGPSPDRLKGRYANVDTTPIEAQISSETKELPAWDLQ